MVSKIVKCYFPENCTFSISPYGSGHINDTFKLTLSETKQQYILQRLNHFVFKNPLRIVQNHQKLQNAFGISNSEITIPSIISTLKGELLSIDEQGNSWRLTNYIDSSYSIDIVEHEWQAYEAGFAFGWFAKSCEILNPSSFHEAIKNFHSLSFRVEQLKQAIHNNTANRLESVIELIDFFRLREQKLFRIEDLAKQGRIPVRVVHNDTKINNVLFKGNRAVAVIDLDTAGPGLLFNDYGDAIRTSANFALEDEKDVGKVRLNLKTFEAFSNGYLSQVKSIITLEERENLFLAPILLTYIMGIRFLTDYLNGDKYYKTQYPEHNFVRSKVQIELIMSMENHESQIRNIVSNLLT
jgi:thiamine kinase-like enzyme